jgi:apolipoprotein N-acyltransferase
VWFINLAINLAATALAAVLFAASFPNLLFERGLPVLAWVAYIPVFWLIRRISVGSSVLWGALYGYAAYGLYNYWLSVFHPLAGMIVGVIYLVYFAMLFPLLKTATLLYPRRAYVAQWLVWMAYEYLRTLGFVGYAYGITGYSQWSVLPVIQIAAVFGVWGVSALVVFPSVYLGNGLAAALAAFQASRHEGRRKPARQRQAGGLEHPERPAIAFDNLRGTLLAVLRGTPLAVLRELGSFIARERLAAVLWVVALAGTLAYGFLSPVDYADARTVRLALVQHNTDPWRGGPAAYQQNLDILKRLSLEALAQEPAPDMVVWSETAFVPRIHWHLTYREDPVYYAMVRNLMDFLAKQDVPFVLGNDDARKEPNQFGRLERVDYNAVMVFEQGKETGIYRKLHLVPFTEHFPYQEQFPAIHAALVAADTHFWKKGEEATILNAAGVRFATPICFEDTFGYLSRRFTRNGAELIVNLTNDAWANSLPAQMQHMAMAVFRAVENRRSMARATASGQTCAIDPNGRILAMADPFREVQLTVDVPISDATTLYTAYGDYLGQAFVLAGGLSLAGGLAWSLLRRRRPAVAARDRKKQAR